MGTFAAASARVLHPGRLLGPAVDGALCPARLLPGVQSNSAPSGKSFLMRPLAFSLDAFCWDGRPIGGPLERGAIVTPRSVRRPGELAKVSA